VSAENRCAEVAAALPGVVDGTARADRRLRAHVGQCLTCQAELARYRRTLRLLAQLRQHRPAVPTGGAAGVLMALEARAEERAVASALRGRHMAVAGAVAGALIATAAMTVLLGVRRGRRGERRASSRPLGAPQQPVVT
jgi:hypothetical protein